MNIIMFMIIMFYMLFPKRLKSLVMKYEVEQPKELSYEEEYVTSRESYFTDMTVKQMVHNPPTTEDITKIMMRRL